MKNYFVLSMILGLSVTAAFANDVCPKPGKIDVYACRPQRMEGGTSVAITHTPCGLQAELFQPKQGGQMVSARVLRVREVPVPRHRMGAPRVFEGKDFNLTVNVDWAPLPHGGQLADLVAEVRGARVNERVVCSLTR